MEYMAQKMDEHITAGILLEEEMSSIVEEVEKILKASHTTWGAIDPRKLVYTIIQSMSHENEVCYFRK